MQPLALAWFPRHDEGMNALTALRLQIEWGADEALADEPLNRFVAVPAPALPVLAEARVETPAASNVTAFAGKPRPAREISAELAASAQTREELRQILEQYDACALRVTATRLVFADGNPDSGLMIVGDVPGAEEDMEGRPFAGAAGRLLDKMLAGIGLDRGQCLLANLIPWRPPGGRPPNDTEIVQCLPFLLRHIELTRPRRLVLMGTITAQAVLGQKSGIHRLRGRWTDVELPGFSTPIPTLPMLHPNSLPNKPLTKREAWADMITLKLALGNDELTETA